MGKPRDPVKERYWRQLMRRHATSGLGARGFCEREGVPECQFYAWRRTLRERDRHPPRDRERTGTECPGGKHRTQQAESPFLSLQLPMSLANPNPIGTAIEVVHPRGYVLRIAASFDATVLRRILATLDLPADPCGERS
jgi:hypothetical protein